MRLMIAVDWTVLSAEKRSPGKGVFHGEGDARNRDWRSRLRLAER